jgi:uncharacterized integral membrane protein (TIGR00698 family)
MSWQKILFVAACLFCLTAYGSPPVALALGILFAFTIGSPYPQLSGRPTKYLLQASIVLLGFGMNLQAIYRAGRDGILFTVATIVGTIVLGYFVGKLLAVKARTSALISSGTAICGGSAIAAVGPAIDADTDEMSVALGTVFVLNAIALFLFPVIGGALRLTQGQFGIWAAIAIHDTSSVVGASGTYGAEALAIATTVKLVRALWIVPVALMFAYIYRKGAEGGRNPVKIPWFIFLFVLAAAARTYLSRIIFPSIFDSFVNLGKAGMIVTLFLIGASLSRKMLSEVGFRPLVQGVVLWVVISVVSLWAVVNLL